MYAHLTAAIERIKKQVAEALSASAIEQACQEAQHTWRERELGPAATIWAFLLQVLHGNTACAHVLMGDARCLHFQFGPWAMRMIENANDKKLLTNYFLLCIIVNRYPKDVAHFFGLFALRARNRLLAGCRP